MIETTLGTLAMAEEALGRLRTRPLTPVVAYRVAVLLDQVSERLVHYKTIHGDLVKEFGAQRPATPQEQPRYGETIFEVTAANLNDFRVRVRELHAEPITIDLLPLDIAALGTEPMTAADMDVLRFVCNTNGHEGLSHG